MSKEFLVFAVWLVLFGTAYYIIKDLKDTIQEILINPEE